MSHYKALCKSAPTLLCLLYVRRQTLLSASSSGSKARSSTVTRRVGGMFSSSVEAERSRRREFMSATRRSSRAKYGGAISCKQRKASTASLNSIRCGTRNQRRSWSSGVMWSHFRAEHSSRAGCSSIHQTQTAVCRVGCLLRRQPSHCRNRGVSLQYEGHCQRL